MNLLVTAGNTQAPIDRVRCLTNIFTGRTGAAIARHGWERGHRVTLLTSHPEVLEDQQGKGPPSATDRWVMRSYRTFDELNQLMAGEIVASGLDAVIHSAAVSDYLSAGIYAPATGTRFLDDGRWVSESGFPPALVDRAAGKVKSDEQELWLRLVRAPKLVDRIRSEWTFRGLLVKFKLEVGMGTQQLLDSAERSRCQSAADLMVANTLEEAANWALLGPVENHYQRVSRRELPSRLLGIMELLNEQKHHG
jgi:phosphopantothenoylcysteine synthetase/decarboxylase